MKTLILSIAALVFTACASAPVQQADPEQCSADSQGVILMITPADETEIGPELSQEFGIEYGSCVETENPGNYDPQKLQHTWCCRKVAQQ